MGRQSSIAAFGAAGTVREDTVGQVWPAVTAIDGHVHWPPVGTLWDLADAAEANFAAGCGLPRGSPLVGCLLLAELGGQGRFEGYRLSAPVTGRGGWLCRRTGEAESLRLDRGGVHLFLIAGRQIRTLEGLELLGICCRTELRDGVQAAAGVRAILAAGGVAVLPWGFGKWMGRRGRLVEHLIDEFGPRLALGDIPARIAGAGRKIFARAEAAGSAIVRGSDPLRLACDAAAAGRFGWRAAETVDPERPAAWTRRQLAEPAAFAPLGRRQGLGSFIGRQIEWHIRRVQVER